MKWSLLSAVLSLAALSSSVSTPAHAASPVPVVFGTTWDGPGNDLQAIMDTYLGVPGAIDVQTGFVGAHAGDLDPWFWVGNGFPTLLITEVAGNADTNELGWYLETFTTPVIDGVDDAIVFDGSEIGGATALITFPAGTTRFGFYLDPKATVTTPSGPMRQLFFTNRFSNDIGPSGFAATHQPFDGDVQALVFDVSAWKGPDTWLVCFEDLDSGLPVQACCSGTDNDFNDVVFQVSAFGATPAHSLTFGAVKSKYR